mmetsp:Transcript_29984/g.75599  ORF Transcript_29984/g.75599 Transcript_29984/m.75599 type:complete len:273 (+) Transcript_29984:477-1295(+)
MNSRNALIDCRILAVNTESGNQALHAHCRSPQSLAAFRLLLQFWRRLVVSLHCSIPTVSVAATTGTQQCAVGASGCLQLMLQCVASALLPSARLCEVGALWPLQFDLLSGCCAVLLGLIEENDRLTEVIAVALQPSFVILGTNTVADVSPRVRTLFELFKCRARYSLQLGQRCKRIVTLALCDGCILLHLTACLVLRRLEANGLDTRLQTHVVFGLLNVAIREGGHGVVQHVQRGIVLVHDAFFDVVDKLRYGGHQWGGRGVDFIAGAEHAH